MATHYRINATSGDFPLFSVRLSGPHFAVLRLYTVVTVSQFTLAVLPHRGFSMRRSHWLTARSLKAARIQSHRYSGEVREDSAPKWTTTVPVTHMHIFGWDFTKIWLAGSERQIFCILYNICEQLGHNLPIDQWCDWLDQKNKTLQQKQSRSLRGRSVLSPLKRFSAYAVILHRCQVAKKYKKQKTTTQCSFPSNSINET